ncbi:SunI/YnzG family protein [Bacillus cereus]|uniref:SunI/YnzG family protein n=1 Tax=Bacillus cereus TaxID=1396 RepID=UPI003F89237F
MVISLRDVVKVTYDSTFASVKGVGVIRIRISYGTTNHILIKIVKQNYLLFTKNKYLN